MKSFVPSEIVDTKNRHPKTITIEPIEARLQEPLQFVTRIANASACLGCKPNALLNVIEIAQPFRNIAGTCPWKLRLQSLVSINTNLRTKFSEY